MIRTEFDFHYFPFPVFNIFKTSTQEAHHNAFYFEGDAVSLPICLHLNQSSLTQQRGEQRIGGSI